MARAETTSRRPRPQKAGFWDRWEERVRAVPASIMVPRLVFVGAVIGLLAFGLAMVYSASSIKGLTESDDASYYLVRQLRAVLLGCVFLVIAWRVDYHKWADGTGLKFLLIASGAVLLAVLGIGAVSHGASRWLSIGGMSVQPAEFIKFIVVAGVAQVLCWWPRTGRVDMVEVAKRVVPLLLIVGMILIQPDKGTTLIICVAVFFMVWDADIFRESTLVKVGIVAVAAFFVYSLKDDYSRQRFLTALNPEADPYGDGYQLVQGFYGFGSGGLFGVGLGMGSQKYSYLPEMHNDFILAVIGEELGVVGCVALMALFGLLFWACCRIAQQAPDRLGQLVALGCGTLYVAAFLLNALGVLGLVPMSGKAIPFVSYGGSAMMASMMGVGMVLSVSRMSALPETEGERRRRSLSMVPEGAGMEPAPATGLAVVGAPRRRQPTVEGSTAGEATPRSFRVIDGGSSAGSSRVDSPRRDSGRRSADGGRGGLEAHPEARVVRDQSGRERIELGRSSTDRLRPSSGPTVRERPSRDTEVSSRSSRRGIRR